MRFDQIWVSIGEISLLSYTPSCVSMATTLRQTYSCLLSWKLRKLVITLVIFSTIVPTSCRNWSIVIGRPIIEVRQVCKVTRFVDTS